MVAFPGTPTNFPNGLTAGGVPVLPTGLLFTGNWYFVDAIAGSDGNSGGAQDPLATIYKAYAKATAGNNDVIVVVGNGSTTGTQRMSVANAVLTDSTATTGTIVWAKNATHLVGMTSGSNNRRARFAPPTGVYTAATFGNAGLMFDVTASGCYFSNFSIFGGFSTGSTSGLTWRDTGGRNFYNGVQIQGLADAASAGAAAARTIFIGTTGENVFVGCEFGLDTVTRTAANATIEFAGGVPRNSFINCVFPFMTSAATPLGIIVTGAAAIDRWQLFQDCVFINNIKSTSTAMTVLTSMSSASPGGLILHKNSTLVGITDFGDTNGLANTYVDGASVVAATSGIAVNPT